MPGITPNEGESAIAEILYNGRNLELGLLTAPQTPDENTTNADIVEVSGSGYGRKTLLAGGWTVDANGNATYPSQVFTPNGADWTGVIGYFIVDPATNDLWHIQKDTANGAPFTIADGEPYTVDPSNVVVE